MRTALEVIGDRRVERDLRDLAEKVQNPRPAFNRLFDDLRGIERSLFASHGHGRWPELKDSTKRQKKGPGPMRESGAVYRSVTSKGSGALARVAGDEAVFGTTIFYVRFQKRFPLFGYTSGDRRGLMHKLRGYLLEGLHG